IVLIPVSVWVQLNSIKMVKMQPEINYLNAKHFGDKDAIAEGQGDIYKKYKYNPLASMIPLIIQLIILMGLIEVIKAGINDPSINIMFYGIDLGKVPSVVKGAYILSPVIAGLSAWIMCVCQNASNVLQSEQSAYNKYSTMIISVGLSLYLGWFVSVGVAVYWVASNLLSTAQLYILNFFINPKKYIDYEELEKSRKALDELKGLGSEEKRKLFGDEKTKREKQDYKRFFSVVNKKLVFYSEGSGFYKYYKGTIEYLLEHTNITIHYITSDYNDRIFELAGKNDKIRAYYIGEKKLITLMMKMDADIVVMTTPDLETYHIKRSYVRKDIEYIFVMHDMGSFNLTNRNGAVDHFDTVFCTGKHQKEEVEKIEIAKNLPKKTTVEAGYDLLDDMIKDYESNKTVTERPVILIGPSWQVDSIMDSCIDDILEGFKNSEFDVIVRPHPQYVRHKAEKCEALKEKYKEYSNISVQTDFSSNSTVFDAAILVTDWSGICFEYAYTTKRPVIFIDTPMKVMNPEYKMIDTVPINITLRNEIGKSIAMEDAKSTIDVAREMIANADSYSDKIEAFRNEYVYNLGHSAEISAKYIINQLKKKVAERKGE
ncbi:MAG: YidC/Oxa1 family membrane protein insertase, partial [Lachnospiraceae bacterium]|nr:YidC/Oxa1 family membrane protein insertase [Lachnospiraceae bacterium]